MVHKQASFGTLHLTHFHSAKNPVNNEMSFTHHCSEVGGVAKHALCFDVDERLVRSVSLGGCGEWQVRDGGAFWRDNNMNNVFAARAMSCH